MDDKESDDIFFKLPVFYKIWTLISTTQELCDASERSFEKGFDIAVRNTFIGLHVIS